MTANCLAQPFEPSELAWPSATNVYVAPPIPLNGMLLWLKADAGVYTTNNNIVAGESNIVWQWTDQSGNTNNSYQVLTNFNGTPYSPEAIFVTNVVNGKPAIMFFANTSTNSFFTNGTLQTPTTMTVFWVAKLNGANFSPDFGPGYFPGGVSQGFYAVPGGGSPDIVALVTPSTDEYYNTTLSGWTWNTFVFNGGTNIMRINGTTTASFSGSSSLLTTYVGYGLGQYISQGGINTNYFIPEYIEYSGVQSGTVITQVESYLTNKYGL